MQILFFVKSTYLPSLALACLLMFSLTIKAQQYQVVDSNVRAVSLTSTFSKLIVSDGITLVFNQSEEAGLAMSASSDSFMNNLQISIRNDTLRVGLKRIMYSGNLSPAYKVYAASPHCTLLFATNAAKLIVLGKLATDSLQISASNAARINANVETKSMELILSSASMAQLRGNSTFINCIVSDASKLEGLPLTAVFATINMSAASKIWLTVIDGLNLTASAASKFYLRGNPNINSKNLTSFSKLLKINK